MLLIVGDNVVLKGNNGRGDVEYIDGKIHRVNATVNRRPHIWGYIKDTTNYDMSTFIDYNICIKTDDVYKYIFLEKRVELYSNSYKYHTTNYWDGDYNNFLRINTLVDHKQLYPTGAVEPWSYDNIIVYKTSMMSQRLTAWYSVDIVELYNHLFKQTLEKEIDNLLQKRDNHFKIITQVVLSYLY